MYPYTKSSNLNTSLNCVHLRFHSRPSGPCSSAAEQLLQHLIPPTLQSRPVPATPEVPSHPMTQGNTASCSTGQGLPEHHSHQHPDSVVQSPLSDKNPAMCSLLPNPESSPVSNSECSSAVPVGSMHNTANTSSGVFQSSAPSASDSSTISSTVGSAVGRTVSRVPLSATACVLNRLCSAMCMVDLSVYSKSGALLLGRYVSYTCVRAASPLTCLWPFSLDSNQTSGIHISRRWWLFHSAVARSCAMSIVTS